MARGSPLLEAEARGWSSVGSQIGRFRLPEDLIENRAAIMALVNLLIRRGLINERQFEAAKKEALEALRGRSASKPSRDGEEAKDEKGLSRRS